MTRSGTDATPPSTEGVAKKRRRPTRAVRVLVDYDVEPLPLWAWLFIIGVAIALVVHVLAASRPFYSSYW